MEPKFYRELGHTEKLKSILETEPKQKSEIERLSYVGKNLEPKSSLEPKSRSFLKPPIDFKLSNEDLIKILPKPKSNIILEPQLIAKPENEHKKSFEIDQKQKHEHDLKSENDDLLKILRKLKPKLLPESTPEILNKLKPKLNSKLEPKRETKSESQLNFNSPHKSKLFHSQNISTPNDTKKDYINSDWINDYNNINLKSEEFKLPLIGNTELYSPLNLDGDDFTSPNLSKNDIDYYSNRNSLMSSESDDYKLPAIHKNELYNHTIELDEYKLPFIKKKNHFMESSQNYSQKKGTHEIKNSSKPIKKSFW